MIPRPAALALMTALAVGTTAFAQAPPSVIPMASAAPAAKPNPDLICMLVANGLGGNAKDAKTKELASLMMIFYLGRVDRGAPNLDLGPALKVQGEIAQAGGPPTNQAQAAKMQAQVQNCVNKFQGRVTALRALSRPPGAAPASSPAAPAPK